MGSGPGGTFQPCRAIDGEFGVDFFSSDTGHTPFGIESVPMIPVLCRARGCASIVRVANPDPGRNKNALDIGAVGVMVPQINNAEEARMAVRDAKDPSPGRREVSPGSTAYLNVAYVEYIPIANQGTCVVVPIETPAGIGDTLDPDCLAWT